jgi:AcrR family transcriptional regulator
MFRLKDVEKPRQLRMAEEVLRQIEEGGIDSVRVTTVTDRLEIGIGTLYRNWGSRESLLEHTWRTCIGSLDHEIQLLLGVSMREHHTLDRLWEALKDGLPQHIDAFFELHSARRRWVHFNQDLAHVVPSLRAYVELGQSFEHFRDGPSHVLASMIWWFVMSSLTATRRLDDLQQRWSFHALQRLILTPERLAEEAIDSIEINVVRPSTPELLRVPPPRASAG